MTDRVTELEVKLAFQEHLLGDLDDVVRKLRDEVDDLVRQVRELREQLPDSPEDPDQKPPHY